ncbi:Transmembrane 9 superfamily [Seminavis robusta]|uniref:Transmembrane 9 superfamily member n=1 Tax=Seminavis robusta TaxID=568900 RepID=A0A9N8EDJ4_9STRA|nr:Transmembrane 9 superfamily [Seminavis robusta]|eukprot:Sro846_g210160.1 Transmembrane 9 superfamily (759) ;mRNA; f:24379-26745
MTSSCRIWTAFLVALLFLSTTTSVEAKLAQRSDQEKVALTKTLVGAGLSEKTAEKVVGGERLSRTERKQVQQAEKDRYVEMRRQGQDEVSDTADAAALRNYRLRNKKRKGLLRRKQTTLAQVLFPGVSPNNYRSGELLFILTDLAESKKTPIPFEYYDLPMNCDAPKFASAEKSVLRNIMERQNLGSRLQGHKVEPAPYTIRTLENQPCKISCVNTLTNKNIRRIRKLVARQYRIQLNLDSLPVLMRSKEYNYAARGYPIGFKAPVAGAAQKSKRQRRKELDTGEMFLYNHFHFVIHYQDVGDEEEGQDVIRITGFDVHPVSFDHKLQTDTQRGSSCQHNHIDNDPNSYLPLPDDAPESTRIAMSYEVEFVKSATDWTDRWDVYLIGAPDDDIHYFSIVNSLMIVLFLTAAVSTIMVRTLRKDIALYNEMQTLEEAQDETGWKLVHGDVFRPPQTSPLLLSIFAGTGAQIGAAMFLTLICSTLHLMNPMKKGQTLSAIIFLYVLSGSIAGYISARFYKFMGGKEWKQNAILTAVGLPGCFVGMFMVLNVFLHFAGAATAVSFFTIIKLFLLWVCVSTPLVLVGSFFGLKQEVFEIPTKINQIARVIPPVPLHVDPRVSCWMGGILPFGSVCIELAFIMSALWLHQIYYVMGFLLAVWAILVATCAQVAMVLCYLQLCVEDYRWWWTSFWNCATAGVYLFLYSLWFLSSRMDMVGVLPITVYLTYMGMISICFGLFCGSVGFLASFFFCRKIYGAVKVD